MTATHRLVGLEPGNLLAFLALLGTLRALEARVPDWRPRVHWDGAPLRPVLTLAAAASQEDVVREVAGGCADLARDHDFAGASDLTFDRQRARVLLAEASDHPRRAALLDALFTDGALKDDGRIIASPLCAMFGQGHQHFLTRLAEVPKGVLPKGLAKKRNPPDLNAPGKIAEALFAPWARTDGTDSFRWDPAEDRRYALRFADPSTDPGRTVHGANRLAAIGLAALPGAAVERRGRTRFLTLGTTVDGKGGIELRWPIGRIPMSLGALRAVIAHPALAKSPPDRSALARLGVVEVRRARRISVGKYFNFTQAEALVPE
ncbi:hypothetical protein [Azospirillum sp. TSO35-2]|uniref:type I-G CRISPR-associated protein, Cas3-extension family n=1 Tax=Azospirillum sp. TSO35-2 TaxID=716796 RepID=UPI000D60CC1C|nr:hypothetical protein [Azospirillum sp. TSO35-2]PWC35925.1 hypothetical protein TSO352_11970 [Azospirillum sp. TSO35-2]